MGEATDNRVHRYANRPSETRFWLIFVLALTAFFIVSLRFEEIDRLSVGLSTPAEQGLLDALKNWDALAIFNLALLRHPWSVFGLLAVAFLPYASILLFGMPPILYLVSIVRRPQAAKLDEELKIGEASTDSIDEQPATSERDTLEHDEASASKVVDSFLLEGIRTSTSKERRAEYNANLLMVMGIIVAGLGLFFFYTQTLAQKSIWSAFINPAFLRYDKPAASDGLSNAVNSIERNAPSTLDHLIELAPKVGMLVFIEFIALFFLRQYRAMRDEYRYFESIRRYREDLRSLILYSKSIEAPIDVKMLVDQRLFASGSVVLKGGDTTQLLEERRLSKDELELLTRMIETFARR